MNNITYPELLELSTRIRRHIILMIYHARSGHPGGPFSATDYNTVLWWKYLRMRPEDPDWKLRDRWVLSNGHCSALIYALLAEKGILPLSVLPTFRSAGSPLQGHPNRLKVPGVEASTGSLGQGIPVAHGMAMGARRQGWEDVRVFCNAGDGELQEGIVWEAIMAAGHFKSDNFYLLVDCNDAQIDGKVSDVMDIEPLAEKFRSFGWWVWEADGHDFMQIDHLYREAFHAPPGKPRALLFRTQMMYPIKPFMNDPSWHGKPPSKEETILCLQAMGEDRDPDELIEAYRKEG